MTFRLAPMLKPMVAAKNAVAMPGFPPSSQPIVSTTASMVRRM